MNKQFKSIFKEEFENFINYKKSIGYDYGLFVYNKYLRLDNYFYEIGLKEKIINEVIVDNWLKLFSECKKSNKMENGISTIKCFAKYLTENNYKNVIIPEIPVKTINFIPHIYTDYEIKLIFDYTKKLKEKMKSYRNYDAYYTILCLLFGCGLRISEVINLTLKDINFKEKILYIIKSKNNVSRIVPMSNSVLNALKEYISKQNYIVENSNIFLNKANNRKNNYITCYNFRFYFHEMLKKINIPLTYENKLPRVHDIRHTYAVKALEQMQSKGFDLYTSISILSVYLGHVSIVETEKYLRLVPEVVQKINKNILNYTSSIYKTKEVYNEK